MTTTKPFEINSSLLLLEVLFCRVTTTCEKVSDKLRSIVRVAFLSCDYNVTVDVSMREYIVGGAFLSCDRTE